MPRSSVCMKTLWKKMNKRYTLPEPDYFEAHYTLGGRKVTITAPPTGFFPTWIISNEQLITLHSFGITPEEYKPRPMQGYIR